MYFSNLCAMSSFKLLKIIIEIPGFGNEKWNQIIIDFKNGNIVKDSYFTDKQRNEIVNLFLSFDIKSKDEAVFSVVIRTLILQNNNFEFQVGGAITFDSEPQKELEETYHKAKAIRKILKLAI